MKDYIVDSSRGQGVQGEGKEVDIESTGSMSPALQYLGGESESDDDERLQEQSKSASQAAWLGKFCGQGISTSNDSIHPLEKVWIALARTNGSCGQLLGQAVSAKNCHDSVRSWLCCLVVWGPIAANDSRMPSRSFFT